MSEIKPIQNEFAGIEGNYGIINQGTGYAVVNILTKEMKAHNISSYLDALKTAEHLNNKDKEVKIIDLHPTTIPPRSQKPIPNPLPTESAILEKAIESLKPDVQRLIRKYAPETVSVDKKSNLLSRSRYKCYDASGNVLGRVRGGSHGDRYWQYGDLSSQKHY